MFPTVVISWNTIGKPLRWIELPMNCSFLFGLKYVPIIPISKTRSCGSADTLPLPFTAVASLIAVWVSYNCCKETFEAFEGKPGMILLGA